MADRINSAVSNNYLTSFYEQPPTFDETQNVAAPETQKNQAKPPKLPAVKKTVSFTALGCDTESKLTRAGYMAAAARAGIADVSAQSRFADQMLARNPQLTLNGTIDLDDAKVKARLLNREVDFTIDDSEKTALEQFREQYVKNGGAIRFNRTPTIDLRQARTADGVSGSTISSPNTKFRVLLNNDGKPITERRILAQYAENQYGGGNLWGANYQQIGELSAAQGVKPKIANITRIGNKISVEFELTLRDRAVVHENYKIVQAEVNRARAAYEDFANNNEVSSFLRGVFNGAVNSVKGTIGLLNLPETMKAVWQIVSSPRETFNALYNELGETWEEFKNAPANKKSEMVGELVGQAVVEILLGKGIGKAGSILAKTKHGTEILEQAKLLKSATVAKIAETFSDEAAQAAANRLRGRLQATTLYAGIPADALADLAVVATNKIKNGVQSFAEFSRQMIQDFGESIRPQLRKLFDEGIDAVYGSRRDIDLHELLGGHTIERHVGKTERWLKERLNSETLLESASTFYNKDIASRAQLRAVQLYGKEFDEWARSNYSFPITRTIDMGEDVGIVVTRGKAGAQATTKVEVRIVKDNTERGWHIVTAFPIPK